MDKSESKLQYGCHCDLEEGMSPDGCVIDIGRTQDCVHAKKHTAKEQCKYWQPINFCAAPTSADSQEREAELPPLPFSPFLRIDWINEQNSTTLYTKQQMQDYARAALAAPNQPMSTPSTHSADVSKKGAEIDTLTEQERFEKFVSDQGVAANYRGDGQYGFGVQLAWDAWQERAVLAAAQGEKNNG